MRVSMRSSWAAGTPPRSRGGVRPHGRIDCAGDPQGRDHRGDVVQSGSDRWTGQGHLVREIDALDGLMGRVADLGGIQFRPQPPQGTGRARAACPGGPPALRSRDAARRCGRRRNLTVIEAEADDLMLHDGRIEGLRGWRTVVRSRPAPWCSRPARFCAADPYRRAKDTGRPGREHPPSGSRPR